MTLVTQMLHWITSGDQNRKFWADYLNWNDGVAILVVVAVVLLVAYYLHRVRK